VASGAGTAPALSLSEGRNTRDCCGALAEPVYVNNSKIVLDT
jgi:hypothetical protein